MKFIAPQTAGHIFRMILYHCSLCSQVSNPHTYKAPPPRLIDILLFHCIVTTVQPLISYLRLYGVAIVNCIWFKSLDCGYTWALLNTKRFFQVHRRSLLWSHCCWTELIHKAATVTFSNAHFARAINTRCRLMKTKRKRRKIPSSAQSAYITKWKLKHGLCFPVCPESKCRTFSAKPG